jgi:hypothetical protein
MAWNKGAYFAASGAITGNVGPGTQNLLSIHNPNGSAINVVIKKITVQGILTTISTLLFSYTMARTTGALPNGGTTIIGARRRTTEPAASAIVISGPTATAGAVLYASYTPGFILGAVLSGASAPQPIQLIESDEDSFIVLESNQGLVVQAGANLTTWTHFVGIEWTESTA